MNQFEVKAKDGTVFLQLPLLMGVRHAFGTRQEWKVLLTTFGLSHQQLLTLKQVHGADVLLWRGRENSEPLPRFPRCDAVITDKEGIALGIWTADCIPILMADTHRGVIAAVHAGWRGLCRGIVQRVISKMVKTFGSPAQDILVGIGPGIGPCCYEVGNDVVDLFKTSHDGTHLFIQERRKRSYLDLSLVSRLQLQQMGIPPENIEDIPLCTACREDLFFSYRRDGKTGRQLNIIIMG